MQEAAVVVAARAAVSAAVTGDSVVGVAVVAVGVFTVLCEAVDLVDGRFCNGS